MKRFIIFLKLICSLLISVSMSGQPNTNNTILCAQKPIDQNQFLVSRIPATSLNANPFYNNSPVYVPSECAYIVRRYEQSWRDEDRKNLTALTNNYCSHMNGWVEYNPGTCSAGGPPPICSANHWYQDADNAKKKYNDQLQKLLSERANQLNGAICNCRGEHTKNAFKAENEKMTNELFALIAPRSSSNASTDNEMKIPCLDIPGKPQCPENMKCVNGWCLTMQAEQNIHKLAQNKLKDEAIDVIIEKAFTSLPSKLGELAKATYRVMSKPPIAAIAIGMQPSTISTNYDAYISSQGQVIDHLNKIRTLTVELQRFYNNKSGARDKPYILNDIAMVKNDMYTAYMGMMNSYNAVIREKELYKCQECCTEVFSAINNQVGFWYSLIMNTAYQ